jgi:hypothetical protein
LRVVYNVCHRLNNDPIISLRSLKPLLNSHRYPKENFVTENHAYIIVGDVPVIITKLFDFDEYNELSWFHKEEIPILASLGLCKADIGWYSLYAGNEPVYVSDSNAYSFDLRDNNVINNLLSFASKEFGIAGPLNASVSMLCVFSLYLMMIVIATANIGVPFNTVVNNSSEKVLNILTVLLQCIRTNKYIQLQEFFQRTCLQFFQDSSLMIKLEIACEDKHIEKIIQVLLSSVIELLSKHPVSLPSLIQPLLHFRPRTKPLGQKVELVVF